MYKIKPWLFVVLLITIPFTIIAQNSTNSPYTRFGYGALPDHSFASQRAMGGIGIGLRNPQMINTLNPASFSSVDSMTFMFDLGVMGQSVWYDDENNSSNKINANLDYLAMQFPLYKSLGMGIGLAPVSFTEYKYGETQKLNTVNNDARISYYGTGGLSKVYGTLSYAIADRVSLGVNVGYLFGKISDYRLVEFNDYTNYWQQWADTFRMSGLVYEFGLQYVQPVGKNKSLVLGATYALKTRVHGSVTEGILKIDPSSGYIVAQDKYAKHSPRFEMPETFGAGVSFSDKDHYTIGVDAQYKLWEDAEFYGVTDSLSNQLKINLGGEFIPNSKSNSFFKRVRYRAGGYYTNSYVTTGTGSGYDEYGISAGFGFPISDKRSFLNLTFSYTAVRPEVKNIGMVDEQYFKITLSYTFNELWFFKRKIQ